MTIVNGRKIRDEIKASLKGEFFNRPSKSRLAIVSIGEDAVKEKFTELKKKFGEEVGVEVVVKKFASDIDQKILENELNDISKENDAVVIQLPIPERFDQEKLFTLIPEEKDIDLLSVKSFENFIGGRTGMIPPVVGAVDEVLRRNNINLIGKVVVIVGKGKLVGKPIFLWLMAQKIVPVLLDENDELSGYTQKADVIISGAGDPHIIKPEMVKEGVVLIDVGTSGDKGTLRGDIDPLCEEKASVLTPTPGGIGPITIAKLFQNMTLA